jgi:hypothetical protein
LSWSCRVGELVDDAKKIIATERQREHHTTPPPPPTTTTTLQEPVLACFDWSLVEHQRPTKLAFRKMRHPLQMLKNAQVGGWVGGW